MRSIQWLVLLTVAGTGAVWGQTARITGIVTDTSGAVLTGA